VRDPEEHVEPAVDHRFDELLLAAEVVIDHPLRDTRPAGDVGDRGSVDPPLGEHVDRRLEQALARALPGEAVLLRGACHARCLPDPFPGCGSIR